MTEAWIIDAVRSPRAIGKPGKGAYSGIHPQYLLAQVLRAVAERNHLNTAEIDDIIVGCSMQVKKQGTCIARMAALTAGYDVNASGVALDRFCGSGITAVSMAASSIMAGFEDLIIAGGVEMMSYTTSLGPQGHVDGGNLKLRELHPMSNVGLAADLIAKEEGFTRLDVDKFGVESQRRAQAAIEGGHFKRSLIPILREDGTLALDKEEYPRPGTTLESISQLKPAFGALMDVAVDETGTTFRQLIEARWPGVPFEHIHHAGNSSGVVDGAGALVLASPQYAKARGLKPRAKIVAAANSGGSPAHILNQPGPAARKVLKRAGMSLNDIDLFEVNEAFAVVVLKFLKDLDVDPARVNVNGGAIALGHPIGATGSLLIGTALDELERIGKSTAMITMCAAGGMAPAVIVERI
ncbi:MAG: acetyl-CoA C-acetyltransferase [Steroidobacteraceae bacterium]